MKGKVFFVGGGPGALDLLTVRAVRTLQQADVVLHDELVPQDFRELLSPSAVVINVGKRCGYRGTTQDAINILMIHHARRGRRVVRLKSGDPSIFGRLGEEIDALREAEIEYEIVPGITAAVAAAASARLTLTERGVASQLTLATASLANEQTPEWYECIRDGSTLVIYMPGRDFQRLSLQLLGAGADPDLPCAVVAHCAGKDERIDFTTVSRLARLEAIAAPAVVIVGKIVQHRIDQSPPSEPRAQSSPVHEFEVPAHPTISMR